jgi:hypothetical protein
MQPDEDGTVAESVPLGPTVRKLTTALDTVSALGAAVVMAGWFAGRPLFYSETTPVMSGFTAFSLLIMVLVRLARIHLDTWPPVLSLAMTGLVLGGNVSSIVMLLTMPPGLLHGFPNIVVTSIITSIGLALFCLYDLVIVLRETPQSWLIFDDALIHLALVPGGLSLLGYLLDNPTYLSIQDDPRIGISPLEMVFMAAYAISAVLSNPRLFLWQFLAAGRTNRAIFVALLANQFAAPVVVAFVLATPGTGGLGIELFVMLAGVVATLSFLVLQAHQRHRSPPAA